MFDHQVVPIATLPMVACGLAKPSPGQGYHPLTTAGPAAMEILACLFPTQWLLSLSQLSNEHFPMTAALDLATTPRASSHMPQLCARA